MVTLCVVAGRKDVSLCRIERFTMLCSYPSFRRKPASRPAVPPLEAGSGLA